MSEIRNLTRNGETFYPLTHEKAVIGMEDFKDTITEQIDNYRPIEITGDVVNAPDEEDITSDSNNLLKFKNRNNLYGLGKVILRRGSSFASQVTQANTIYVIQYNFDLGGARINMPNGSILLFEGGALSNGTLFCADLYNVRLVYYQDQSEILSSVTLEGNFIHKACDKDTIREILVDNSSITKDVNDVLSVKDNGIQNSHLNNNVVDNSGIVLDSNNKISIKDGGVTGAKLNSGVVNTDDLSIVSNKIQLADRGTTDGMGKIILRKNLSFASQLTQTNTIYVIRYDFTLTADITIPSNCVLQFEGGSIGGSYVLNLNNTTRINGKGIKCEISNPYLGITPKLSDYLCDISNSTLNRKVIQALTDANYNLTLEIDINDQIILDAPIEVRHLVIKGGNLYFNDSDGFKFSHAVYSSSNFVDRLTIRSKGHCFDFFVSDDYVHNIYTSSFTNINAYSEQGSCFYAGPNKYNVGGGSDSIVFDCKFERIWVGAPNGAGFYGLHSNTMVYRKIDGSMSCALGYFYNCVGLWDSVNSIWNIGYENFLKLDAHIGVNATLTFINCNFEGFKNSVIAADSNSYVKVAFINCQFLLDAGETVYYPLNIGLLKGFVWLNSRIIRNASGGASFVYTNNINNRLCSIADELISIKDAVGRSGYMTTDLTDMVVTNGYLSASFGNVLWGENINGNISRNRVKCKTIVPNWTDVDIWIDGSSKFVPNTEEDFINLKTTLTDANIAIIGVGGSVMYGSFVRKLYIRNGTSSNLIFVPNQWPSYKIITDTGADITLAPGDIAYGIYDSVRKRLFLKKQPVDNNFAKTGTTRPTGAYIGQSFYDKTLERPIWYKGKDGNDNDVWIDAAGNVV